MKPFGLIRCLLFSHAPNRRKVRRSSSDHYIGHCVYCGSPIKRLHRDKWARDWARSFGLGGQAHQNPDQEGED